MPRFVLLILDGFGIAPLSVANPRSQASTPTFDRLEREAFAVSLQASGIGVGLPWGEPGNSEAGHLTIGAGRLLYHHLPRIVMAIQDGSFFTNRALKEAFAHVRRTGGRLHVMGLVSSGSVHSYPDHLYALFEMARRENLPIELHVFTDGRDADPHEARKFLPQIEERMRALGVGHIRSLIGRHFAMDRDGNWERTARAYRLLVEGQGERTPSIGEALENAYVAGLSDEFLPATVIAQQDENPHVVQSGDALIFFNFREDSARQLAEAFGASAFGFFPRREFDDFAFVTLTSYERGIKAEVAFPAEEIGETLGATLAKARMSQLRIAETEKYAHVTYFLNGGMEEPFPKEERRIVHSRSDATADAAPAMRAQEIVTAVCEAITRQTHDAVIANFANADMVGHTGNFIACARALEVLDRAVADILQAAAAEGVPVFLVSDHGNIEEKRDRVSGRPLTEHSLNPVPFFVIGVKGAKTDADQPALDQRGSEGLLIDVAPTILAVLGIGKPASMTGQNLLK